MLLLGMHNTVAFILIMIFILPFVMSNTAMKINLQTYNGDNFVCTKICFGSFPQCFNLQLDFQSFFTWIYNKSSTMPNYVKSFNTTNSSSFILNENDNFNITYPSLVLNATGAVDKIEIENVLNISDFKFALVNTTSSVKFDGVIGLGYLSNENEKEYSFLEQLYLQKKIAHRVFGIEFSSYKKTHIFFGEVPTIILKDYYHYANCDLLQKKNDSNGDNANLDNPNWQCMIKRIWLPKTFQEIKEKLTVVFSLNTSSLIMPYHLLSNFEREYRTLIDEGSCWFDTLKDTTSLYCSVKRTIPTIIIDYEKWRISIPEKILKSKSYFYYYKIMSFVKGQEQIIFSLDLLKYFILIFDRENDQIGFYNSDYVSYIGRGLIKKPNYEIIVDPSIRNSGEISIYDIKMKIRITLIVFSSIIVITVIFVTVLLFYWRTSKKKDNDFSLLGSIVYNGNVNAEQELDDIDIRDVIGENLNNNTTIG